MIIIHERSLWLPTEFEASADIIIEHDQGNCALINKNRHGYLPMRIYLDIQPSAGLLVSCTPYNPAYSSALTTNRQVPSPWTHKSSGRISSRPPTCDCGAAKSNTTHASWCSASGAGP